MRFGVVLKLRTAVQEGNLRLVKRCILRDKVDSRNTDSLNRWTSLHYAVRYNHPEVVSFLLDAGHERYGVSVDIDGKSPLMIAAVYGCDDIAKVLLQAFPHSVAMTSQEGWTALPYAARHGNDGVIAALLDHGADINGTDEDGSTALHHAAAWGQFKAVQLLVERGCRTAIKNHAGWGPLDYSYSVQLKKFLEESARRVFEDKRTKRRRNNTIASSCSSSSPGAYFAKPPTRDRSPSSPMPTRDMLRTRSPSLSFDAPPRISSRHVQLDMHLSLEGDSAWKSLPLPPKSAGPTCVLSSLVCAWRIAPPPPLPLKSAVSAGEVTPGFAHAYSSPESTGLTPRFAHAYSSPESTGLSPFIPLPFHVPALTISEPPALPPAVYDDQTGTQSPPPHVLPENVAPAPGYSADRRGTF